jgi:transposase
MATRFGVMALAHQVQLIEQEVNRQARRTPAVALLRIIPGVGARTAEAVAVFADDPHRYPNAKAVGRYFGLVPSQDRSGERNRLGPITREARRLAANCSPMLPGRRVESAGSRRGRGDRPLRHHYAKTPPTTPFPR